MRNCLENNGICPVQPRAERRQTFTRWPISNQQSQPAQVPRPVQDLVVEDGRYFLITLCRIQLILYTPCPIRGLRESVVSGAAGGISSRYSVISVHHSLANRHSCSTSAETRDRKCFIMQLILVVCKMDMINHICQMLSFC